MNGIYDEVFGAVVNNTGLGSTQARALTSAVLEKVADHLHHMGNNFIKNGYPECGKALHLEADTIIGD